MHRPHPGFTVALRLHVQPLSILDGINPMQVCTLGTKNNVIAQVREWDKRASGILESFEKRVLPDMHDSKANAQLATWGAAFHCFVLTYVGKDYKEYCAIGDYTEPDDYNVYQRSNDVLTWVQDKHSEVASSDECTFELTKCFVDAHQCCLVGHDGTTNPKDDD